MNYRHAFHAGNFADLVKHAALLELLGWLRTGKAPLAIIDTHAGRGLYDLAGPEARKSGEAEAGIAKLMTAADAPDAFDALKGAVRRLNVSGALRRYPGSPQLIAEGLRPGDSYLACELQADEHVALSEALRGRARARALCADGYAIAAAQIPASGRALVLIDPPFERADDYARSVETLATVRRRNPAARALVWMPLKDLETFDAFLRDLEDEVEGPFLVAEARMRPLSDPLKMNGCALVVVGAPDGFETPLAAICDWTTATLGQGGAARVYSL